MTSLVNVGKGLQSVGIEQQDPWDDINGQWRTLKSNESYQRDHMIFENTYKVNVVRLYLRLAVLWLVFSHLHMQKLRIRKRSKE